MNDKGVTSALLENMRDLLALIYTMGFFGALAVAMFHGMPQADQGSEAMKMLLTIMATAQVSIIGFYFGAAKSQPNNGGTPNVTAVNSNVSTESTRQAP